jgi:hypothetical protein
VFDELDRILLLVPAHRCAIHLQAVFQDVVGSHPVQKTISNLSNPKLQQNHATVLSRTPVAVMFVKIPIAVPANLEREAYWEAADRLAAQMGDR